MADSTRFLDWYDKAEKDLFGAKILLAHEGDTSLVTFHCQQAIEKALKGYILKNGLELIEGHSLIYLCKQALKYNNSLKQYMKDCAYVNQFYIETRYPADVPTEINDEEAKECIEISEKIINYIKE